jgi:hypothetical protein
METPTKRKQKPAGSARTLAVVLALATAVGGMSSVTARADDRGRHVEHRHYAHGRGGYVYERPQAYYAPPPVDYYQPPPPSPAIDFVFPLHIR